MKFNIFSICPVEIFHRDCDLTPMELKVYACLLSFRSKNTNTCWPGRDAISRRIGYHVNAISMAVSSLEKKGYLETKQRRGPNIYTIKFPDRLDDLSVNVTETLNSSLRVKGEDTLNEVVRVNPDTLNEVVRPENTIKKKIKKRGTFVPPTLEDLKAEIQRKGFEHTDPQHFLDHYESEGWKISSGRKMKDWKIALSRWNANAIRWGHKPVKPENGPNNVSKLFKDAI